MCCSVVQRVAVPQKAPLVRCLCFFFRCLHIFMCMYVHVYYIRLLLRYEKSAPCRLFISQWQTYLSISRKKECARQAFHISMADVECAPLQVFPKKIVRPASFSYKRVCSASCLCVCTCVYVTYLYICVQVYIAHMYACAYLYFIRLYSQDIKMLLLGVVWNRMPPARCVYIRIYVFAYIHI